MSVPSNRMRPASARTSPTTCFMSTLLPAPEVPMMKKTLPFGMVSSTPSSTRLSPKIFTRPRNSIDMGRSDARVERVEDEVEGEVEEDDRQRRVDHGARGRAADAGAAAAGDQAGARGDHRDHQAEGL